MALVAAVFLSHVQSGFATRAEGVLKKTYEIICYYQL